MSQMASASTSAASIQKSSSTCCSSKHEPERRKSQDTICSSTNSCILQKRKPVHPLAATVRFGPIATNVKQRVVSAKLLKLRSVQSQLNDANFHLAELARENRALRTLQKRQDKALIKYEGVDAELPRLMKSYEEQVRVAQEKNKAMKRCLREVSDQIKLKDDELSAVKTQLRHLVSLTKDKHLGEREKLKEELDDAKELIKEQENKISMLNRRLELEMKNLKYQLNNEIAKHKHCQRELGGALAELRRLSSNNHYDSGDQRPLLTNRKKVLTQRQTISNVSFQSGSTPELSADSDSTTDLKLEPIRKKSQESLTEMNGILKCPTDNIKARLSSDTKLALQSLKNFSMDDERPKTQKTIYTIAPKSISRTNSNTKLEILSENLQTTIQKAGNNDLEQDDLGGFCMDIVKSVKSLNSNVDVHKVVYETSTVETVKLLDKLKETDVIDSKIRNNQIVDELKLPDNDVDIVNKIWFEEYNFRNGMAAGDKDNNGNVKDAQVSKDEKKKLLATLKAIDNGELVESLDESFTKKNKIMKELFGHGAQ